MSTLDSAWGTPEEGRPRPADERRERLRTLVRRSALFVPVNVPRFVEKAHARGADAVILDLEDSVPAAEKRSARALVRDALGEVAKGGADVLVRINKPTALAVPDMDACVWPGLAAIHVPKVESAREVAILEGLIAERERARGLPAGGLQLSLSVETALGLENAVAIALASPRAVAIGLGAEDLTLDLEVEPSKSGQELAYGKARMVVVARLADRRRHPLEVPVVGDAGHGAVRLDAGQARQLGFMGAACIHPAQVEPLNVHFAPAADEVARALRVVAAFEAAEREGRASVGVDGKMVDVPVAERARRLLARAAAIEAREARKREALARLA